MSALEEKIDRVLALTERLTAALLADIDALERGKPSEMRSIDPETQQVVARYARETASLRPHLKCLPAALRGRLVDTTTRLHDALGRHERRVARVRHASEGMIRAIVDDVERKKRLTRPYALRRVGAAPASMLFNGVV